MSINRILVPIDFSPCADKALELGLQLAKNGKAELIICHINPVPAGGDAMFFINAEVLAGIERGTENAFQKLQIRFPRLQKVDHKFIQRTGLSINKLRDIVREEKADLIVMGTKGRDKSIEAYFGSNTTDMTKRSDKPVLAVPENSYIDSIRSILLATDFDDSNHAESMKILTSLATILEAEIHLVHVIKDKTPSEISINPDKVLEWAKVMKGIKHHYHFVNHDNVRTGIIRYAYENDVQMLAILGKSYNLIDRLFHKSLSKKLVYHSKLPLLVLPE